jgi:uncharacterized protein
MTETVQTRLWEIAKSYYSEYDWAHGLSHIKRVARMAMEIGNREGANLEVLELAVILHDIYANEETHSTVQGFRHEIKGSKEARRILDELGVKLGTIDAVCHCIESHRKRTGNTQPHTIEAKCLFDADKLDCLGAIGVVRCAFISYDQQQEFYRDEDVGAYKHRNIRPDGTVIDFKQHSSNLEYELSLRQVPERLYTKTGKQLAEKRARFMHEFYDRLRKEMRGHA